MIPPIILLVVFLILIGLLRAVVAPLVLIGTVILSFLAALGVGYFVFDVVFGFPGSDPSLPLFAFVFLVALGRRLQHLPDRPRPRGDRKARLRTGHPARPRGHRRRHHQRRHRPRRHLLGARRPPPHLPHRARLRRRLRRPPRHLPRPQRARARDRPDLGDKFWWPSALSRAAAERSGRRPPSLAELQREVAHLVEDDAAADLGPTVAQRAGVEHASRGPGGSSAAGPERPRASDRRRAGRLVLADPVVE